MRAPARAPARACARVASPSLERLALLPSEARVRARAHGARSRRPIASRPRLLLPFPRHAPRARAGRRRGGAFARGHPRARGPRDPHRAFQQRGLGVAAQARARRAARVPRPRGGRRRVRDRGAPLGGSEAPVRRARGASQLRPRRDRGDAERHLRVAARVFLVPVPPRRRRPHRPRRVRLQLHRLPPGRRAPRHRHRDRPQRRLRPARRRRSG